MTIRQTRRKIALCARHARGEHTRGRDLPVVHAHMSYEEIQPL